MPIVFDFENRNPTVTPPFVNRPGSLTSLEVETGSGTTLQRGQTPFDIMFNTGQQEKPLELGFGELSLDPYFQEFDVTPFTLEIGKGERGFFIANTVSITMGDYGEDDDLLVLQAFDENGALLGEDREFLPADGLNFTSRTLTVTTGDQRIQSIKFIGGSADRPNSVFYDNITFVYTPTKSDLKDNPYWGGEVGQAVADAILEDALNGRSDHVLNNLNKWDNLESWRRAVEAFQLGIGEFAVTLADASAEQWVEAFKKAALETIVPKLKGAALKQAFGKTGGKIASLAVGTAKNAAEIAQAQNKDPFSLDVLEQAGAKTVGSKMAPGGLGGKTGQALVQELQESETSNSLPSNGSTKSFAYQKVFRSQNSLARKVQGSSKNDKLSGNIKDNYLFGKGGNNTLQGQEGWDILIGDVGNDRLLGGEGADVLNGCGKKFVAGEVDHLIGGTGVDIFVLGDPKRYYYDDKNRRTSGTKDYALIKDFNPGDFIVLKGKPDDYIFRQNKIFLNNDGVKRFSKNDELIAEVKGAASLSPVDIIFV